MQIRLNLLLCALTATTLCALTLLLLSLSSYKYSDLSNQLIMLQNLNWSRSKIVKVSKGLPMRSNPCKRSGDSFNISKGGSRKCMIDGEPSMLTGVGDGRLGNQMLCYATIFAIGRYNNRRSYMSPGMSDLISKYFKISLDTMSQDLLESIPWKNKKVGGVVDDPFKKVNEPYVKLVGVPQAWKYFDELRPLIRNQFQFYDEIVQRSKMKLRSIREEFFPNFDQISVTFVGIHVRRGDYVSSSQIGGFHVPGIEFYTGAMLYFEERYNNVIFVIASDDIPWCKENFATLKEKSSIHFLQSSDIVEEKDFPGLDLAVLTHCNHVIYGLGSFGFWAGYLGPGEVIFCSDCMTSTAFWLRDRNVYNGDYGNAVLPSWIGYSRFGTMTNRSVLATSSDLI